MVFVRAMPGFVGALMPHVLKHRPTATPKTGQIPGSMCHQLEKKMSFRPWLSGSVEPYPDIIYTSLSYTPNKMAGLLPLSYHGWLDPKSVLVLGSGAFWQL